MPAGTREMWRILDRRRVRRNRLLATRPLAEGARFELADPLRGLQFSRLARSAAPSPLHALLGQTGSPYDGSSRPDKIPLVRFYVSLDPDAICFCCRREILPLSDLRFRDSFQASHILP